MRQSDLYMIGIRPEARLRNFTNDEKTLRFDFIIRGCDPVPVVIQIHELPQIANYDGDNFTLEIDRGGTGFRIWSDEPHGTKSRLLEWFTTESLLWHAARGRTGIYGLEDSRALSTFDLLYVGIATEQDSFERLINKGHQKRMEILSSEYPLSPGARVSDEVTLFLFTADPLVITTIDNANDIDDDFFNSGIDNDRIIADAEKAFVSLLKPQYNEQLFKNYPKSVDGLYQQGLKRYGYVIGEEISFVTPNGIICGGVNRFGNPTSAADTILVEGDEVRLVKDHIEYI